VTWAWALALPLGVQSVAMLVDEGYFHRRRGLGRWERVGHPLDTLTVLACLAWVRFVPPSGRAAAVYAVLASLSCLFITKDEPVHARQCTAGEHWIHALLFVVHPVGVAAVALLWPAVRAHGDAANVPPWLAPTAPMGDLVGAQLVLTGSFFVYQTVYWNFPWPRRTPSAR
jgi:hypothetical protein